MEELLEMVCMTGQLERRRKEGRVREREKERKRERKREREREINSESSASPFASSAEALAVSILPISSSDLRPPTSSAALTVLIWPSRTDAQSRPPAAASHARPLDRSGAQQRLLPLR